MEGMVAARGGRLLWWGLPPRRQPLRHKVLRCYGVLPLRKGPVTTAGAAPAAALRLSQWEFHMV